MSTASPLRRPLKLKLISKAAFDSMSIHARRVAIAKDVLLRLKLRNITADTGEIIDIDGLFDSSAAEAQRLLNGARDSECVVCARGALLVSWVGNFDSMAGNEVRGVSTGSHAKWPQDLLATFGLRLIGAIETAFEKHIYNWNVGQITDHEGALLMDLSTSDSSAIRMKAVFSNIVRNGGKLVVGRGKNRLVID